MNIDRRDAAVPARAGGVAREQETSTVDFPTEKCRTCPAQIIWAVTERGKDMPVDAEPGPGGNVQLVDQYGQLTAVIVPAKRAFGRTNLRKSHFVTCPQAGQWRRSR